MRPFHVSVCLTLFAALAAGGALAQAPKSDWSDAFANFAAADARRAPGEAEVVFVGSSSIRLWSELERTFDGIAVLNRGFGGSQLSDCAENVDRLVVKYRPRAVFVYAGDNDLAAGAAAEDVLERFRRLATGVRAALPDARIVYISIKPSPARSALLHEVRRANALIRAFAETQPGIAFVDVFSAMTDTSGSPRRELFLPDDLHLNASGYAVWKRVIAPYVREG